MKVAFFQCEKCHEWRYSTKQLENCTHDWSLKDIYTDTSDEWNLYVCDKCGLEWRIPTFGKYYYKIS